MPTRAKMPGFAFDDEERMGWNSFAALPRSKRKAIFSDTTVADGLPPGRHQGEDGMTFGGAIRTT